MPKQLFNTLSCLTKLSLVCLFAGIWQGCAGPKPVTQEKSSITVAPSKPETDKSLTTQDATTLTQQTCACEELPTPKEPQPTPPPERPRARYTPASWENLPDWGTDSLAPAITALLQTCSALSNEPSWKPVCSDVKALPEKSKNRKLQDFFEAHFTPYQVINSDGSPNGMITGYYEPILFGSTTPNERYRYPLYSQPDDLLTIDLSSVYPELKHKRLRGRLQGNRVIPYYNRAEIEVNEPPIKGRELAWVDDPVDVAFLQIQGSGQIKLDTGEIMRVGYANQNGHPFRSIGRYLIQQGMLKPEQASMQGIRAWAQKNPDKVDEFLNFNPSYVFFRELPLNLPGPLGSLGVPLTAERSIAIDPRAIPLGVPVYLATTWPNSNKTLNRLMLAQDTGGAINGGVRADFYWGSGDTAGQFAGRMKQSGQMWILLPKGMPIPNSNN